MFIVTKLRPQFCLAAARLMHKYNAHGATDVTGFGLLGHAQNLAKNQKNEVSFVIHNLPIIAKMAAVAKACGNMFHLLQVRKLHSIYSTPVSVMLNISLVTHSWCMYTCEISSFH